MSMLHDLSLKQLSTLFKHVHFGLRSPQKIPEDASGLLLQEHWPRGVDGLSETSDLCQLRCWVDDNMILYIIEI
jgi:hypothetical protein